MPVILGIWGTNGNGKTFQTQLVYKLLGIDAKTITAEQLFASDGATAANLILDNYFAASNAISQVCHAYQLLLMFSRLGTPCFLPRHTTQGHTTQGHTALDTPPQGKMSALYISDLDASGLAESDQLYQQCSAIAAILMDIADSPEEVQGVRCNRVPIVSTGNNFRTFYGPLISKVRGGKRIAVLVFIFLW